MQKAIIVVLYLSHFIFQKYIVFANMEEMTVHITFLDVNMICEMEMG